MRLPTSGCSSLTWCRLTPTSTLKDYRFPKGESFSFRRPDSSVESGLGLLFPYCRIEKRNPPTTINIQGRNQTAPRYFPTEAFRRLTPASTLSAESATEADSALQARMVECANPCSCAARAGRRIPLLLIINLFDGTKSQQKVFKGAVIR